MQEGEVMAVRYEIHCRENDVYRIERAEVLEGKPDTTGMTEHFGVLEYLDDALAHLGVKSSEAWAWCVESLGDLSLRVTAWRISAAGIFAAWVNSEIPIFI